MHEPAVASDIGGKHGGEFEVTVPSPLDGGHEKHVARVLDEFLRIVDAHRWPAALAERRLAEYALLAEAAARTTAGV